MIEELKNLLEKEYNDETEISYHYNDIKSQFLSEFLQDENLNILKKTFNMQTQKLLKKKICDRIRKKYVGKDNLIFSSKRLGTELNKIENEFWEI